MGRDPHQERAVARLIDILADPQAPLELPCGLNDLDLFIEKAGEFVKHYHRMMPDRVRERFEQAVKHARDLLDDLSSVKLLN